MGRSGSVGIGMRTWVQMGIEGGSSIRARRCATFGV